MPARINPLDHPVCLAVPERLAASHWAEHLPFAMWLTSVLRPRLLVELGTYNGTSYCGFCQAIASLGLDTRAFAVDSWRGDPYNGSNGPEVLDDLRAHHDAQYAGFSTLLEMTFDEARTRFGDGEIDLLHIDGYHTYDAVRHDFEGWLPKLSGRGVVLFHDVCEHTADFGVWRLWEELTARYPSFTFHHEHGLGVLAVGREQPEALRALLAADEAEAARLRALFAGLGDRLRLWMSIEEQRSSQVAHQPQPSDQESALREAQADREAALAGLREAELSHQRLQARVRELEGQELGLRDEIRRRETESARLGSSIQQFQRDAAELHASVSWRLTQRLSGLAAAIAPPATRRRRALRRAVRALEIAIHEGPRALPLRLREAIGARAARWASLRPVPRVPWLPDGRPVFLIIHHRGGGGIQTHVSELVTRLRDAGVRPVEVYPHSGLIAWEDRGLNDQGSCLRRTGADHESIVDVLETIAPAHAHVHSMMGLPDQLLDALSELRVSYDWTLHDYYVVCPRAHLNRADDAYCGEPDEAACDLCLSRLGDYRGQCAAGPISAWRRRQARYLAQARRVFAPSADVRGRISRYMPELEVTLRPHPEVPRDPGILAAPPRPGAKLRVAILGNIVGTKGSRLLLDCARHARSMELPLEFVVLGRTDRDASLARLGNVRITGPYAEGEIFRRLAAAECQLALLPSLVPETFMYTLSIAMAARLYTIAFDLGAQAERLRAWGWGCVLPADAGPEAVSRALLGSLRLLNETPPPAPPAACYPDILSDYYEFLPEEIAAFRSGPRRTLTEGRLPHFDRRNHHAPIH